MKFLIKLLQKSGSQLNYTTENCPGYGYQMQQKQFEKQGILCCPEISHEIKLMIIINDLSLTTQNNWIIPN